MTALPSLSADAPLDPLTWLFLDGRPRTRAEVMAESGHARSTVGPRIEALVRQGMLVDGGSSAATGGRRPMTFQLNPAYATVAVIDLAGGHVRVALTDLRQKILAEERFDEPIDPDPDVTFDVVERLLRSLLALPGIPPVGGIGVALAAPIDPSTGLPQHPPGTPRWHGYDIAGRLARILPVPVRIDRNNNLMAVGELATAAPGTENMIYVNASTWIGAGVVVDGKVVRGATGQVGHIGHVRGPWAEDDECTCGKHGCLEAVASGSALVRRLHDRIERPTTPSLIAAAENGDSVVTAAIRESGRKIGLALAPHVSVLNPASIVLGGSLAEVGTELLNGVRESLYREAFLMATEDLTIRVSDVGGGAVILGASVLGLHAFLRLKDPNAVAEAF
ncbi:ROK family protein [Streptomyces sp. NPDC002276]